MCDCECANERVLTNSHELENFNHPEKWLTLTENWLNVNVIHCRKYPKRIIITVPTQKSLTNDIIGNGYGIC